MKLRVLHVVAVNAAGTISGFAERQIERLTEVGVDARVVRFAGASMLFRPHRLAERVREIRREVREFAPDLVHAHWGSLLALASAAATLGGPPLVITYRGSDINPVPSEARVRSMIRVACSQIAACGAAAAICVSEELARRLWCGHARKIIIPDGTDLSLFRNMDRVAARRHLGWGEDERVVFFYEGGRPEVKRRDLAEAAVAHAASRLGACRLEVMGSNVPHELVPVVLNAADCLLMTSDYEGSPNIVREGLACGTPIVSVDVGDVRRWLAGVAGTCIVQRDPQMIGEQIAKLIASGIRPSVGARVEEFGAERSCSEVMKTYERVLAERGHA